jgi:BirA family transcriptional regulator, biotin operon repressor / biotin---[acetyl-CoA-carboxylase] ligase
LSHSFRSVVLDEVGSTNTEALARASAAEAGPLWIMARRQTRGRGRSGREWASDPGNLYASLLQRLACPQSVVHQVSLLAGVAVVEAIRALAGPASIPGLRLKWPNDILIGAAKCAGILPESQLGGSAAEVILVVGVGINLASHPTDLGRAATHLAAHGVSVAPEVMLEALAASMHRWLTLWDGGSRFADVRSAWLGFGGAVGEPIMVNTGSERVSGTFLDLDAGGALIVRDAQGLQRRITFGDVALGATGGGEQ